MEIIYRPMTTPTHYQWLKILNHKKVRKHLIPHPQFDELLLQQWISGKVETDSKPGCRIRAIMCNQQLAGWCGIQEDAGEYELAVVVHPHFIGVGLQTYKELMKWSKDFGHRQVLVHFLHTRPLYRFLQKRAISVRHRQLYGQQFTSYTLAV